MSSLVRRLPEKAIVYLDRPQRLGFLPTLAFWNRRDVWRIVGLPCGIFAATWVFLLSEVVAPAIPKWASLILAGLSPLAFLAILERVIRKRLRPRAVATLTNGDTPSHEADRDEST